MGGALSHWRELTSSVGLSTEGTEGHPGLQVPSTSWDHPYGSWSRLQLAGWMDGDPCTRRTAGSPAATPELVHSQQLGRRLGSTWGAFGLVMPSPC